MSIWVAESLSSTDILHDRFTDPDAFLFCDNPDCSSSWVTTTGLVVWALVEGHADSSRFTDHLLAVCSPVCLDAAKRAHGRRIARWSRPMPAATFLDALRNSLDIDPETTEIGEFVQVA